MKKSKRRTPTRRKAAPRRRTGPSDAALRKAVRPIVEEMLAKFLERLEDRLDAQDAAEALKEPGEISHEEFRKRHGL